MANFSIISMNGSGNKTIIKDLLGTKPDLLISQEHWLQKRDLSKLNHFHKDYLGKGVSPIPEDKILIGRPYGGVAIFWRRDADCNMKFIKTESDRICAIMITTTDNINMLVINVYLPCDNRSKTVADREFIECLNVIEKTILSNDHDICVLAGDCNIDFQRNNAHSTTFEKMMERHALRKVWNDTGTDTYTFITPEGNKSHIDHFFMSPSHTIKMSKAESIDYKVNTKPHGHLPICLELEGLTNNNVYCKEKRSADKSILWHKVDNYDEYKECIENILISGVADGILDLPCFQCTNIKCRDNKHRHELDKAMAILTDMCIDVSKVTFPCSSNNVNSVPHWNDQIQYLKEDSKFWGQLWKDNGRPVSGELASVYRHTRKKYHAKIEEIKCQEASYRKAKMAEDFVDNNTRNLWSELKKIGGNHKSIPPHVDGFRKYDDICNLFYKKYEHLYNSVPCNTDSIESDINKLIDMNSLHEYVSIDLSTVLKAICKLKSCKGDGDKGLVSNMIIQAPELWVTLLCEIINCMILHGHNPTELLNVTLSSINKDLNEDICDSSNFRGIALTSCIYKVIDWVILIKYESCFKTTDLQFAYKSGLSTTMCTLTLKEVVKYYNERNTNVYCALVDASKAFDRVRFDKMFQLLIKRKIPIVIVRLLFDLYMRQKVRTSWCGVFSEYFTTSNGVRQGGVLSPILFIVYIDELIDQLMRSGLGCFVGYQFFGALGSADDLTLLAPSPYALRQLLLICEKFGIEYDILYNGKKTKCILFPSQGHGHSVPVIQFCGAILKWQNEIVHLGNIVTCDLSDEADLKSKRNGFIASSNSVISNFKTAQRQFCCQVFIAQCCHLYGCQMWDLNSDFIDKFYITWKRCIRKLWYLPNISRSNLLPYICKCLPFKVQLAKRFAKMYNTAINGSNDAFKFLCYVSIHSRIKGIIGKNIEYVENIYDCSITNFRYCDNDDIMKIRSEIVRELSQCLSGGMFIENWSFKEISSFIDYISCY